MTDIRTGPEHLAEAARLAKEAEKEITGHYGDAAYGHALAAAAQVHAAIAQTLVFAVFAADESDAFGKPWQNLLDPDGALRRAEAAAAEQRRAKARADQEPGPFETSTRAPELMQRLEEAADVTYERSKTQQ